MAATDAAPEQIFFTSTYHVMVGRKCIYIYTPTTAMDRVFLALHYFLDDSADALSTTVHTHTQKKVSDSDLESEWR